MESDPPVEDAGVTEKQPEKQPEEGGSQQPEGLESDQPVEDARVTDGQLEEGGWQQPEDCVDPALGWSWGEDGRVISTSEMKAKKEEAKETAAQA